MTTPTPSVTRRLDLLDYTRFVAALMVVGFHWGFGGIQNGKLSSITDHAPFAHLVSFGYLGVQVFFVISGFVIAKSYLTKTARQFAVGRFIRLYPTFWVALCITSVVTIFLGSRSGLAVYPKQFIANLTMLPTFLQSKFVDGVYWTLEFELIFYALVFLMLLFRLKRFIPAIFVFWSLAITLSFFIGYSTIGHSLLSSYFSYFLTGALISEFYRTRHGWIIPVLALSIFTNIAYAYRQVPDHIVEFNGGVNSPMIAASIVTVFIALIMLTGLPQATRIRLPWAQEVGALTYPIYLLHAHIGYILLSHQASNENRLIPYLGVFILILLLAWVLHRTVEVKMGPHIKRFLDRALDSIPYPRKAR